MLATAAPMLAIASPIVLPILATKPALSALPRAATPAVTAAVLVASVSTVRAAVIAFVWAARSGQFDDTDTPAIRPLIEDDEAPKQP